MNRNKIMSFVYFLAFVGGIGFLYSFTTEKLQDRFNTSTAPEWENLKVLPQDISKDSLFGLMKGFTKSLGVNCAFCHTPRKDNPEKLDFPSDDKHTKLTARGMIEMTREINEKYFLPYHPDPKPKQVSDVTCVTCHRGNPNPKRYLQNIGTLYGNMIPMKKKKEE